MINFTILEGSNTALIDGEILAVIFDDPSQVNNNTIVLLFGAQNVNGDTFNVGLSSAIDKSKSGFALNMSLGISYGAQEPSSCLQFSTVDVDGNRLTSSAGGQDDGQDANGALITAGGVGDSTTNPSNPNTNGCNASPALPYYDDELYDLAPFVNDGDTNITIHTQNPSNDDNIFFAGIFVGANQAVVGKGVLLTPATATNPVGTSHTVTATVRDSNAQPVADQSVGFTITSGPNAGATGTCNPSDCSTDDNGQVTFTYSDTGGAGTDHIQACIDETNCSAEATKTWINSDESPVGPTSEYYLTAGQQGAAAVVQASDVKRTWVEHHPDTPGQYAVAVLNTVRIMGAFLDRIYTIGSEYNLQGVYTGYDFPFVVQGAGFWDGASDGTHNYSVDYNNGGVYRFDTFWGYPAKIFSTSQHYLGITFDQSNNTLWISNWDTGVVEHRSINGQVLSTFPSALVKPTCLALDPADGTLWMGSQNNLGTFYQFAQDGTLKGTRIYPQLSNLNTLGGEFRVNGTSTPPPPPAPPKPKKHKRHRH